MSYGEWTEFEEAPTDGTVLCAATTDLKKVAFIKYRYCDGDMDGAWVYAASLRVIPWRPEVFIEAPTSKYGDEE